MIFVGYNMIIFKRYKNLLILPFSLLLLFFPGEKPPLEQDQVDSPAGHATVGEIEHRLEKDVPAKEGHP